MSSQNMFIPLPEELGEEIECDVIWHIESTGIGSYEFWGQKCYDRGIDYPEIDSITAIFTDESESIKNDISKYIKDNYDKCCDYAEEKLNEVSDY